MKLSEQLIDEFASIITDDYGKELSDEEIRDFAYDIAEYFDLLLHSTKQVNK